MKKIVCNILFTLMTVLFSSCLTSGLEELDVYDGADITSVSSVRYRYITADKNPASGENEVKEVELIFTSNIDTEAEVVSISIKKPENFPPEELDNLSTSNLLVVVGVSTAARVFPQDGAPKLGTPGDWSKPNKFVVEAADGTKKTWTIEVVQLEK